MQLQKTSTFTNLLNFLLFIFKASLLCANHCFLTLKTVLTLQYKWAQEEELCLNNNSAFRGRNSTRFWVTVMQISSLFIHITNFLRTANPIQTSASYYYLKHWYFQIIECLPSSKLEVRLYTLPPHIIWEWWTDINTVDQVCRITRPFMKYNFKFMMLEP